MYADENDESSQECLKIHGYISSSEGGSDEDKSKSELDKRYEDYKPPPLKIDPAKQKVIIIGQSDDDNNSADDENYIRNNVLYSDSEALNQSFSRGANKRDVNIGEILTLASDVQQSLTKPLSKRRRRRLKKRRLKSDKIEVVNVGVKLNLISDDESKNEEKCRLSDLKTINHAKSGCTEINELVKTRVKEDTLEGSCCYANYDNQLHLTNDGNSLYLDSIADVTSTQKAKTQDSIDKSSFQFNERTSNVANSTLSDEFLKIRESKNKTRKKTHISEENCEPDFGNDFSREDINTRNQKFEDITPSAIAEYLEYSYEKYSCECEFCDKGTIADIYLPDSTSHAPFRSYHKPCSNRDTGSVIIKSDEVEVVNVSIKLNPIGDDESENECWLSDHKTISHDGIGSIEDHELGKTCQYTWINKDTLGETCCDENYESQQSYLTNNENSLYLDSVADVRSTNDLDNVSVNNVSKLGNEKSTQKAKNHEDDIGKSNFQFNDRTSNVSTSTLLDEFVKKHKSKNKRRRKKKLISKENCEPGLGSDFSREDINTRSQNFEDVTPSDIAEFPEYFHHKYSCDCEFCDKGTISDIYLIDSTSHAPPRSHKEMCSDRNFSEVLVEHLFSATRSVLLWSSSQIVSGLLDSVDPFVFYDHMDVSPTLCTSYFESMPFWLFDAF